MNLSDIFPEASIRDKFSAEVSITSRDRTKLKEIVHLKRGCMVEIGGSIWDRYVQQNPDCNPQALASFFAARSPKIYLAVERHTGLKVLKDILYISADIVDDALKHTQCAQLLLAITWPNVLRISEVSFTNPYAPIPASEKKYLFQDFKGLGLFPELLKNCEQYCLENNVPEMTLAAAYIDLVPFFESHGFSVEDTLVGRNTLKQKRGIPMRKML